MREYGKVSPTFWTGKTGRQIQKLGGIEAVLLAFYLMTNRHSNMIGLYYLPVSYIVEDIGVMPFKGASKGLLRAFEALKEADFAFYDDTSKEIYLPEMATYQIAECLKPGDRQIQGVMNLLFQYRKSCFFWDFYEKYKVPFNLPEIDPIEAPSKALRSPLEAPCKPLRSQEQEQEQENNNTSAPKNGALNGSHLLLLSPLSNLWNKTFKDILPQVKQSGSRKKREAALLRQYTIDQIKEVFSRIVKSDFLLGKCSPREPGGKAFMADYDWFLGKDKNGTENIVKVLEGKYDNRPIQQELTESRLVL